MNRKTHKRPSNGDEISPQHIPYLYSYTYRPPKKRSFPSYVIPTILAAGVAISGLLYSIRDRPEEIPQEQSISAPAIISNTPFTDTVLASNPDELNLPLSAKNLGHLVNAWPIAFTTAERINAESEHPFPRPYLNALLTWESGLEKKAEHGSYERGFERIITSATGARGPMGITSIALKDYNDRHDAKFKWDEMAAYAPNISVGLERLRQEQHHRKGNLFLTTLDYVSGRGTTNHLKEQYNSIDKLTADLYQNQSHGKPHKNPKKRITRQMIKQATIHPYQVAVLTYLYDKLERAEGLDPERGLCEKDMEDYAEFLAIGERTYHLAEEKARKEEKTTFARFYNDRLIRENLFNGDLLAMHLEETQSSNQQ
ncbi:MAG: hypothetical protein ABIJ21_04975 [Nanoarchaeota archaeon]